MARNGELIIVDKDGREMEIHRLPYGATLAFPDGADVNVGDRLAEWDPFTMPIITEKSTWSEINFFFFFLYLLGFLFGGGFITGNGGLGTRGGTSETHWSNFS